MEEWEAQKLIQRDENEPPEWGQKFRDSFCLSDVFLGIKNIDGLNSIERDLARFLDLLFGVRVISPRKDEYGMYLAQAAALRSAQLSRQVGAAILSEFGDVLALGTNEVPSAGGGQYWEDGDRPDSRDHQRGQDSTDQMEREILQEILENVDSTWHDLAPSRKEAAIDDLGSKLKNARVMNLTEFGRAVHAEMEAITSAARIGVSVRKATLYTTTFPCHGCAKHLIGAGIDRVVYIEPYPKSLARDLHADAICLDGDEEDLKVRFEPFLGIAPRRYADLFSIMTKEGRRLRRKDHQGRLLVSEPALRLAMKPSSYIQRESVAAKQLSEIISKG